MLIVSTVCSDMLDTKLIYCIFVVKSIKIDTFGADWINRCSQS